MPGEEKNDPAFVKELAALGDLYVNDAFSAAHRAHASTEGLAHVLPAYAGRTMQAELDALDKGLEAPKRPVVGHRRRRQGLDQDRPARKPRDARSTRSSSAAAWPTPSSTPWASASASRSPRRTSPTPPCASSTRRARPTAPSSCRVDGVCAYEFKAGRAQPHLRHRRDPGGPDDPRRRLAIGRADQFGDQRCGDAGLERPARRLRDRALRPGHGGGRAPCGASAPRPASSSRWPAAATRSRPSTTPASRTDFTYVSTAGGAFLEWLEGKALPGVDAAESLGGSSTPSARTLSSFSSAHKNQRNGGRHGPHHLETASRSRRRARLRRARLQHQQHGAGARDHGGGRTRSTRR